MTQSIEILISPDGQSKIETKGFAGESCREASRFLEEALGSRLNEQLLPDFYQLQSQAQSSNQRQQT